MSGDLTCSPWKLRFGASIMNDSAVEFRVWAPKLESLSVRVFGERPRTIQMTRCMDSEFSAIVPDVAEGADYLFLLTGGRSRPDPVSRWQPDGVHGASRIVNPATFTWSDSGWK